MQKDKSITIATTLGFGIFAFISICILGSILYYILIAATEFSIWINLIIALLFIGGGLLFFAVIRERYIESKSDRYKDVEI